jgi:ferritin
MTQTNIRLKLETKQVLNELKVIERESYDSVISRLIQNFAEEQLELNDLTKSLLQKRLNKVDQGKVLSTKELMKRLKK